MALQQPSFAVAPMLNVTDRHCRVLLRLLSRQARLYTEMVVAGSLLHAGAERFLGFDASEHPLALQLGGSQPAQLAACAKLAEARGYDEVNLNVGCPSARVQQAEFGACLMAKPQVVANCVAAMQSAVDIPVTLKTRIGIDARDSYDELAEFVQCVGAHGCRHFIVHARKAWLSGLNPKQNRALPELNYARVYQLQQDFPALNFSINGGITSLAQVAEHLQQVDGVMLGRAVWRDPWLLTEVDQVLFAAPTKFAKSRVEVVYTYLDYVEQQLARGVPLRCMSRHLLPLFHAQPGGRAWRRYLSEHTSTRNAGTEVIEQALTFVSQAAPVDKVTAAALPE